ncbi:Sugar transporter ERD6-like 16 [Vitis vinifera]|uniref:Sugar transporter ERD6-like 16 n=1 Tax=Vitis vinifera TaxID=29760 RepID=A0A438KLR0_VITVI|nr:Sugar transporter ERD6-like 16 [Vitis vinifera]
MGIHQREDVEKGGKNGLEDLKKPLVQGEKIIVSNELGCETDGSSSQNGSDGSIWMVLLSTFVAVCGSFEFGSCVGYSAPTQSAIREDLDLSLAEYSMFGSILTIGAMLGAITSGLVTDSLGRKGAMRMSASFCITGWLAVYFSMGALLLDMGRFFTGYGIGIFSYVVPIFIAEIAPKSIRGGLTTLNQLMIVCGSSVAFLLGTVTTWRTLALTGLVPCLVLLIGLFFVPESPRWLVSIYIQLRLEKIDEKIETKAVLFQAKVGREKEFEVALRRLRGKDADVSKEAAEIQVYIENLQSFPKAKMLDLFQTKYIRSLIIGVGLMVFQQFGGINGIGFYVSETFVSAGLSSSKIGTIAYACIQVPITIVGAILMDKSGRRPLLMVSASGTFLGCFLTGASFFLKSNAMLLDWVPVLAIGGVLLYIASFSIGMGAVPWVIMSEIFPINVKGAAGSLVVLVNWLGAWVVSYTFNFLMSWSPTGTFSIYAGFSAMTILFVAKIVPETKGKTLEEIQACIDS